MSEVYTKFISNHNKGLVWKLLSDDGAFTAIPETKASLIKDAFDRKFESISTQIGPTDNLVNLDKRVITEMLVVLKKYKSNNVVDNIEVDTYNAAEIAQKRQKVFESELNNKKKEFDAFNNTPVPDKIDFSDNLDSPIGSEMDKIVANQIALREKQLNMVLKTQDKEAATKWFQNPSDTNIIANAISKGPITPEPIAKLKIGEKIQLDIKEPIKQRKVAFSDTVNLSDNVFDNIDDNVFDNVSDNIDDGYNFLSLLKKKDTPTDDTVALLREIITKQNQILELLKHKM